MVQCIMSKLLLYKGVIQAFQDHIHSSFLLHKRHELTRGQDNVTAYELASSKAAAAVILILYTHRKRFKDAEKHVHSNNASYETLHITSHKLMGILQGCIGLR